MRNLAYRKIFLILAFVILSGLTGCATAPTDPEALKQYKEANFNIGLISSDALCTTSLKS